MDEQCTARHDAPTRENILRALHEECGRLRFGLREPFEEKRYVSPTSFWQRIKQVFTGPVRVKRVAEIEIGVLAAGGEGVTAQERQQIWAVLRDMCPPGISVTVLEFECPP